HPRCDEEGQVAPELMEPFQWTRQSVTFLALIAVVTVVLAVAAPFGSIALGVLSLLAVGLTLIKAMFRARRWWPLTAVEGTIAMSALVLMAGGVGVVGYSIARLGTENSLHMMVGWPTANPTRDGAEYVGWAAEHNAAVDEVTEKVMGKALPSGRNAHFPDPEVHKQFVDWLTKKGIR